MLLRHIGATVSCTMYTIWGAHRSLTSGFWRLTGTLRDEEAEEKRATGLQIIRENCFVECCAENSYFTPLDGVSSHLVYFYRFLRKSRPKRQNWSSDDDVPSMPQRTTGHIWQTECRPASSMAQMTRTMSSKAVRKHFVRHSKELPTSSDMIRHCKSVYTGAVASQADGLGLGEDGTGVQTSNDEHWHYNKGR
jgi:hypothetical protein